MIFTPKIFDSLREHDIQCFEPSYENIRINVQRVSQLYGLYAYMHIYIYTDICENV